MPAEWLLYLGFAAMGVGAFLAFAPLADALDPPTAGAVRYAAVLLVSAVGGLIPGTLFSLAVRLAPGERTVSTTVGWMQQCSSLGQFAGPPLVGWVAARAGGLALELAGDGRMRLRRHRAGLGDRQIDALADRRQHDGGARDVKSGCNFARRRNP